AALQQEPGASRHGGKLGLEIAHLLDEDQRREVVQMALHLLERTGIRVLRDLEDRLAPPAIQPPRLFPQFYSPAPPPPPPAALTNGPGSRRPRWRVWHLPGSIAAGL